MGSYGNIKRKSDSQVKSISNGMIGQWFLWVMSAGFLIIFVIEASIFKASLLRTKSNVTGRQNFKLNDC
jgi:hypothetical protein